jgi:hypothetical protein
MLKRENLVIRNRIGTSNTFHSSERKKRWPDFREGGRNTHHLVLRRVKQSEKTNPDERNIVARG